MTGIRGAALFAPLLAVLLACGRTPDGTGSVSVSVTMTPASPDAAPAVMLPIDVPDGAPRVHLARPCRAIAVHGAPTVRAPDRDREPFPIGTGASVATWVTLGAGDSLVAKLPRTGREVTLLGPGIANPCADEDAAWVLEGRFQGARGSGESPGAEEWVVTPFAVVRYGAAILEVAVDADSAHVSLTRVSLKAGSASVLREGASAWQPVSMESPEVIKGAPHAPAATTMAEGRCAKADGAARALEDALLAPGATTTPSFAETAMRAQDARVLSRALCAMAKVRGEAVAARRLP